MNTITTSQTADQSHRASAPEAVHPALRAALEPGERVIRTGQGKGASLSDVEGAVLGIVLIGGGYSLYDSATGADANMTPIMATLVFVIVVAFLCFVGWTRAVISDGAHYALTDRRVLFLGRLPLPAPGWWNNPVRSLSGQKLQRDFLIRKLVIHGRKTRGRITLRGPTSDHCPAIILTGVAHPRELAELIKSTLNLSLPIEDYT